METQVITPETVYWITRLDGVHGMFVSFGCLTGIAALIVGFVASDAYEFGRRVGGEGRAAVLVRWIRRLVLLFVLCFAAAVLIPTTKEMCAILVIPKIANNADVQGVAADVRDLAKEWLRELKPKAEDSK